MTSDHPLPAGAAEWGRAVLAGREQPVTPRPAATVMLVRPAGTGIEVYLLRRTRSMAFAPGMHVFPGGGVDPRDAEPLGAAVRWAGPAPAEWGRRLAAPEPLARALVCAAVRETFEESGVLLAGTPDGRVVADTRGDDWEADRLALIDRSLPFVEFLDRRDLVLRSDLLRPWARWITPVVEPRRYDTRFFAAVLPEGQLTRDVGGEADQVLWARPADAVAAWRRGEMAMLPPTAVTLGELARHKSPDAVLAAEREIVPVEPRAREEDGRIRLVLPEGVDDPV
ncbi:NUDIX hydrolase [Marinactinospora rubrisoli]|uniref:NUDIX hydrolase n=1 Tax=Marinactinospora rubrisoli TaxID=2715399 RepID=A0ABW2K8B8_9ACTN